MNGEKNQSRRIKIAKSTTIAMKTTIGIPFALYSVDHKII